MVLCLEKEPDKGEELLEQCKQVYREAGYSQELDFPGEYYFMCNPISIARVRLYYSGGVWEY
jgi:hypothetical protein